MSRKKVLFLIHTLGGGGAERVLVDTVNKLDKKRFDVTVMTVIDTGVHKGRLSKDVTYKTMIKPLFFIKPKSKSGSLSANSKGKVKILGGIYTWFWRVIPVRWIYSLFIKETYDVEVAFLEGIASKVVASSTNRQSRKIAWIHVDFENEHKSAAVFNSVRDEYRCYDKFDQLIAVSDETKRGFCNVVGVDADSVQVVHNVLDVADVICKSKEEPSISFDSSVISLVSVGRLASQKGYDRLLAVANRLNDQYKDIYKLYIIGDGVEMDALQKYVDQHNLTNVELCGYIDNPYALVGRADLFVISSRAEGFSTVMSEAIALEVPLVTTRVSGTEKMPDEVVVDNSEDALYEKLFILLGDADSLADHKVLARRLKSKFDGANQASLREVERQLNASKD